jgi:hypothetical protein
LIVPRQCPPILLAGVIFREGKASGSEKKKKGKVVSRGEELSWGFVVNY